MSSSDAFTISPDSLQSWSEAILREAGAFPAAAKVTAQCLVDAARRGIDSHGPALLQFYLPCLRTGAIRGDAHPEVIVDLPGLALVDGHHALGAYVATFAVGLCCDKADQAGAAVISVRNSTHFGAASFYAEQAARRGCIGIVLTNGEPCMAPLGALRAVLCTNPIAIAAPPGADTALPSLDIATSVVAQGKIATAQREGSRVPLAWAIGRDGHPTEDPAEALAGCVLPMAGHKGFGLAFMIDVLAGCLTGALTSPEICEIGSSTPQMLGHSFIAIRVSAIADPEDYATSLSRLVDAVHATPMADGVPALMIPGEREDRMGSERSNGIPLEPGMVRLLQRLGEEYGMAFLV